MLHFFLPVGFKCPAESIRSAVIIIIVSLCTVIAFMQHFSGLTDHSEHFKIQVGYIKCAVADFLPCNEIVLVSVSMMEKCHFMFFSECLFDINMALM